MISSALIGLLGDLVGTLELDEFHAGLMDAVRRAVPADWVSVTFVGATAAATAAIIDPPFGADAHAVYARHALDNPLVARYQRTRDGRVYRFSDVCTPEELHSTALYREFYGPIGLEHQIAFTLPSGDDRLAALVLSRRHGDFSDAERDLLAVARPVLIQCYRNAIAYTRLAAELERRSHDRALPLDDPGLARALAARGVTGRQAQVLSWVATGRSYGTIAAALGLSERTVQKHVQVCFAKLGVHSRAEAVAYAWAQVGEDP